MDSIEKALRYAETGQRLWKEDPNDEPFEVYAAIDALRKNPKYFLDWWSATTEFRRSKLMRSNHVPSSSGDDENKRIEIIHANQDNERISEDT